MRPPLASAALLLALGSLAGAPEAAAFQKKGSERVDYTAYTLKGGEWSLGPLKSQVGILDELLLGTYVPTWFAFPFLGKPIPTAFLKVRVPLPGKLALSARANFVYVDADVLAEDFMENEGSKANVFVLPLEVAASYRFNRVFTQSVELTYVATTVDGSRDSDASIRGAAALTNLTASTLSEWRLTRVTALTLLTRTMVYRGNAHVTSEFTSGSTVVDADLGARDPYQGLVFCAVPGVAFSFKHVNFQLGLGFGNFWLPAVQLPLPDYGLVPEADFSLRF